MKPTSSSANLYQRTGVKQSEKSIKGKTIYTYYPDLPREVQDLKEHQKFSLDIYQKWLSATDR